MVMEKVKKYIHTLVSLLLLNSASTHDSGHFSVSLWGEKVDFLPRGSCYWRLKASRSIPALKELSVCVDLWISPWVGSQLSRDQDMWSEWTAFMYRHPDRARVELGLEGCKDHLYVWVFGRRWSACTNLALGVWHSVCLSWSRGSHRPQVYVNRANVPLKSEHSEPPLQAPPWNTLAANGSLTLGVSHYFAGGGMHVMMESSFPGSVALFRMWGRARNDEQLSSRDCMDGDVVHWDIRDWNTGTCAPVSDARIQCAWSLYEVKMKFVINRSDRKEIHDYEAEDILRHWLGKILPQTMYLYSVSASSSVSSPLLQDSSEELRDIPKAKCFDCLVHLNVIPELDVGKVQADLDELLSKKYYCNGLQIITDQRFIRVNPVESFPLVTFESPTTVTEPPAVTTPAQSVTTPAQSVTTPAQSVTTPAQSVTTPAQSVTTPAQSVTTPAQSVTTPAQSVTTPAQSVTTPAQSVTTPAQSVTTPAQSVTTPAQSVTTPAQSVTTPAQSVTTPAQSVTTPAQSVTTPAQSVTTPAQSVTTPAQSVTTPAQSVTTPALNASTESTLSDSFFRVNLTVTSRGLNKDPGSTIQTWLRETLSKEDMSVLNFQLLTRTNSSLQKWNHSEAGPTLFIEASYSCVFQVQTSSSNVEQTEDHIRDLLDNPYSNGSMTLFAKTKDIMICHMSPGLYRGHRNQSRPEDEAQHAANRSCVGTARRTAGMRCLSVSATDRVLCAIVDLEGMEVTPDSAADVVHVIENLLADHRYLKPHELDTVLNKLAAVVSVGPVMPSLGEAIINIISDILEFSSHLQLVTNKILNIVEMVGDKISDFNEESFSLTASALSISVVNVDPGNFPNLTFGVSSAQQGLNPEIYINQEPFDSTVAFVFLPSALQSSFPDASQSQPRVQFQFYGVPELFKDIGNENILNTFVVSASVTKASGPIRGLKEPITVTLHHREPKPRDKDVQCVYWDFEKNGGDGGWNPSGCWMHNTSIDYTTCLCDHLTHFGVLLDVSRTHMDEKNERILRIITYLGCGVSSFFLGITVLTYTAFEKLRRDYPSKILLNLSLALLGLNLVFLLNSWLSSFGSVGLCIAVATAMHYFLLASYTWMGLEAVNMYFALVKVFNVYMPSYILKVCILGWGVPLVICCLVLVIKRDAYGSDPDNSLTPLENSDDMFCWVQDDVVYYVSVVGYSFFVLLCNMAVFIVVLVQIRNMRRNQPVGTHGGLLKDLRGVASLTFLLGLTWAVAFLALGPARVPLFYLFAILNSLQGFFIFVFHCLMKENVRKQWRVHLCLGRFRLQDYSEWSQTATVGAKSRHNQPANFFSVSVRSNKSSTTESTSASSDSSQRQVSIKRPNLDLVYENILALPRAQLNPSPLPHNGTPFPGERGHRAAKR